MATWRARGYNGAGVGFGHVKRHLWGFEGPLHDGRVPLQVAVISLSHREGQRDRIVCVCGGLWPVSVYMCASVFVGHLKRCFLTTVILLPFLGTKCASLHMHVHLFGQLPCKHILCAYRLISQTVIAFKTSSNTTQIVTESHPRLMIM